MYRFAGTMIRQGGVVRDTVKCSRWMRKRVPLFSHRQHFLTTNGKDPADQHRLFLEQMNELNEEQKSFFGSSPGDDPSVGQQYQTSDQEETRNEQDAPSESDIEQLKQDREHLYGFTEHEQVAWGAHGANKQHDPSFLDTITRKRQEHFDKLDQSEKQIQLETLQHDESTYTQSSRIENDAVKPSLSHVSADGSLMHMVDVGDKARTTRTATAETIVRFPPAVFTALQESNNTMPKGPVFSTAITAGIMAAKQTSNLIPLCHPLFLSKVNVTIDWIDNQSAVSVQCECKVADSPTGVEMEALTGCTVAALTIYDMVKAVSHDVELSSTRLLRKKGGKRNFVRKLDKHM